MIIKTSEKKTSFDFANSHYQRCVNIKNRINILNEEIKFSGGDCSVDDLIDINNNLRKIEEIVFKK